jgi:hypothetical protein
VVTPPGTYNLVIFATAGSAVDGVEHRTVTIGGGGGSPAMRAARGNASHGLGVGMVVAVNWTAVAGAQGRVEFSRTPGTELVSTVGVANVFTGRRTFHRHLLRPRREAAPAARTVGGSELHRWRTAGAGRPTPPTGGGPRTP